MTVLVRGVIVISVVIAWSIDVSDAQLEMQIQELEQAVEMTKMNHGKTKYYMHTHTHTHTHTHRSELFSGFMGATNVSLTIIDGCSIISFLLSPTNLHYSQRALLRCETNHHLKAICAVEATASALRSEISSLEVKIGEVQALVEKKEMETKLAMQCELEAKQHQQHLEVCVCVCLHYLPNKCLYH